MKKIILALMCIVLSLSAVEVGKLPPAVSLEGKDGGKLDGSAWHSSMLKGKIYTVFYVDPDERDLNNALADINIIHYGLVRYYQRSYINPK